MSMPARSLLGLSILETNLENAKSKEEKLKEIIKKQNRVLKEILNERKSENEDKIPDDSKVEEVPIKTEEGKKVRRSNRKATS